MGINDRQGPGDSVFRNPLAGEAAGDDDVEGHKFTVHASDSDDVEGHKQMQR